MVTMGVHEASHGMRKLRAELASGAVVHVVDKHPVRQEVRSVGRHRAWITPQPEQGAETVRVSCQQFSKTIGAVLELVRDEGVTAEVVHHGHGHGEVAFCVSWCPPESLASAPGVLQWHTRSRLGRLLLREFADATAVAAS